MGDKYPEKFRDEVLCKDIKVLTEILGSLSNSYRLLVGAAEEFNRISLVHRHEAEDAIDRADELGEIIDDVQRELKQLMKLYLQELMCKVEIQQLYDDKLFSVKDSKIKSSGILEELDEE